MYLLNLTMHQFSEVMDSGQVDTVLIPIGMLEAHGEHCALGTDTLIPREFVRRLEQLVGDRVVMAPEVPYGHSFALAPFRGTVDVTAEAFSNYVLSIGLQLLQQGFRRIVLFNGHGGNMPALVTVSEQLADAGAVVLTINWWVDYRDLIVQHAPATGHAGEDETSCVLAIDEKLVQMEYAHDHVNTLSNKLKAKDIGRIIFPYANNGDATKATMEKGVAIYESLIPAILADLQQLWDFV
ncbi:MAG: creatininase family protein [Bacilli bacterium]